MQISGLIPRRPALWAAAAAMMFAGNAAAADLAGQTPAAWAPAPAVGYDWTGFYFGVHSGQSWGNSNWRATSGGATIGGGSMNMESADLFNYFGSWLGGVQAGYNYMLPNRLVIGAEADISVSTFYNFQFNNRGNTTAYSNNAYYYSDNTYESGTIRGRVGYAPGNWLFYATGGLAWAEDHFTLYTATTSETTVQPRLGWVAGGGIEGPLAPHWTVRAEYLYNGFGDRSVNFLSGGGQKVTSDLSEQQFRLGVNYQLNDGGALSEKDAPKSAFTLIDPNDIAFHGQINTIWQGYPAFHAATSVILPVGRDMPTGGMGRETAQGEFYMGLKLWKGAELWINQEFDQGYGLAGTSGVASFPSDGAFRFGSSDPYVRLEAFFIRQTIELGGTPVNVSSDFEAFAGTTTSDRLVLTVGRINPLGMFSLNSYNNPMVGTINWAFAFPLVYDIGADAWAADWGGVAELDLGRYTFRAGIMALAGEPDGGAICTNCWAVDPTFHNFTSVLEAERRHELWGQPGKLDLTVLLDTGKQATFKDALAWGRQQNVAPDVSQVRTHYATKPSFMLNTEQQIMPGIGVFAYGGWMYGGYEVFEASDVQRSFASGVKFSGTLWDRPLDSMGLSYGVTGISHDYLQYLQAGGQGVLAANGPGNLSHPGLEQVAEAYYTYALSPTMNVGLDYQLVVNPVYNTDRGPVSFFAGRFHVQF